MTRGKDNNQEPLSLHTGDDNPADVRIEHDSLGPVEVPCDALYGAQTQRAVNNFRIGSTPMPPRFIHALALVKCAAAHSNTALGLLPQDLGKAIAAAAQCCASGELDAQFPVSLYQTGSGTSSNMNANEVIAALASREAGTAVSPNDHVNLGQSSNDVIPCALQLASAIMVDQELLPALLHLRTAIDHRAAEMADVIKTGRTHLMDAVPLRMDQELSAWSQQLQNAMERLLDTRKRLHELPLGGTAVGTGLNAHPEFGSRAIAWLASQTGLCLVPARNPFERIASQDTAVELSGQLRVLATALLKISNDLRWMNSGPNSGLAEISLPALQPGSSIMPGKVNPVIPEAAAMAATQCIGLDAAVASAGQSGNFQLNVMLPLIAANLLQMCELLAAACRSLADQAIAGFSVNRERIAALVTRNPILVTALNPVIGYEKAARIAREAFDSGRPVLEVAAELSGLPREELERLLDPAHLTRPPGSS